MEREPAKSVFLDLGKFRRVIVTSDLHGDLKGFEKMLDKCGFSDNDALLILGDILEKGDECLPLLKKVAAMAERGNTFMLMGNNDIAFYYWQEGRVTDDTMVTFLGHTERSVLLEMSRELNIPWSEMPRLHEAVFREYAGELGFLTALPHIIETPFAYFSHAGLEPLPLSEQDFHYCIGAKEFARTKHRWDKPLIVGHWPTSNYSDHIISAAPYINRETNVISIDGGNSLKTWGQINYVIFDEGRNMSFDFVDRLPLVRCLDRQSETKDPELMIFPKTRCELREDRGESKLVYLPETGAELEVRNEDIYDYRGTKFISDLMTYRVGAEPGDVFSLCERHEDYAVLKRNGVVGKYFGRYEII